MKKIIKNDIEREEIIGEENNSKAVEVIHMRKKKKDPCRPEKWTCENSPLWRTYVNSYLEKEKKLELDDKFNERVPAVLQNFPNLESTEEIHSPQCCLPLSTFNESDVVNLPDRMNREKKIRIWRNMKANPEIDMSSFKRETITEIKQTDNAKWPGIWPCIDRNIAEEIRQTEIIKKRKLRSLLPYQDDPVNDSDPEKPHDDFADHKELGHARIPKFCMSLKKLLVVERSCGEKPGLVDGDYITFELTSRNKNEKCVYAEVCLRGMKGMHLIELSSARARKKTWKFCFYQALVVLLAKTQLRYKYASSINIDYIYDHAWLLFIHMGSINIKNKHRFDDVVVYNYKYNVELELVQELKDQPKIIDVDWKYLEKDFKIMRQLKRPELMKTTEEVGWEKIVQSDESPVHEKTKNIEKWFDKLPISYHNCVFRTNRFSLAFWNDGNFWYLYNPYRCDRYGFWDDEGYACIIKFCTRATLRRHLMILLLRAYVYKPSSPLQINKKNNNKNSHDKKDVFTIQIFQMIYHCVKIHNIKLLQRKPPKRQLHKIWKQFDECSNNYLTSKNKSINECKSSTDISSAAEDSNWLNDFELTWTHSSAISKKENAQEETQSPEKSRWHQYYIEQFGKLFSLWGEIHPAGEIFTKQNRGKQMHACYVVCAGMMRIMAPEYWSAKTLDAIVMCGDRYYTLSRHQSEEMTSKNVMENTSAWSKYLTRHFTIGEMLFEVDVLSPIYGKLYTKDSLWKSIEQMFFTNSFGIFTCENVCLGVFKFCGSYYMLDVGSIGPPLFNYGDGVAYLLRATSFHEFIVALVLTIGSIECSSFVLEPIDIVKIIDVGSSQLAANADDKYQVNTNRKKIVKTVRSCDKATRKKFKKNIKSRSNKTDQLMCKATAVIE
ncbi:hypothetical protein PV328_002274 [Microctonus aethiopoides]|uniref:Uncharacterized protein n=1 Tax=Microctonus aethiopoides TaxID=144406 RepID=A0AA39FYQ7_9HYME|nr:hypothetical protein PV328_002274 [Microctonus aethiopoides]